MPKYTEQNGIHSREKKNRFEFESIITNENLLYILDNTDRKKILLLDTRPSDVFQQFRITSCDVINIPKDYLVSGYKLHIFNYMTNIIY